MKVGINLQGRAVHRVSRRPINLPSLKCSLMQTTELARAANKDFIEVAG
jgi:hypothetical protein